MNQQTALSLKVSSQLSKSAVADTYAGAFGGGGLGGLWGRGVGLIGFLLLLPLLLLLLVSLPKEKNSTSVSTGLLIHYNTETPLDDTFSLLGKSAILCMRPFAFQEAL